MEEAREIGFDDHETFGTEKRANGTEAKTEPYSPEALSRLQNLIVTFQQTGEKKYYAILVDGEMVVEKNADGQRFNNYLKFMGDHTKTVEVRMYKGKSFNCNRYVFILNPGLNGFSGQAVSSSKLQELQVENEQLKIQLAKKKKKLKKLKKGSTNNLDLGSVKNLLFEGKQIIDVFRGNNNGLSGAAEPEAEVTIEAEDDPLREEAQAIFDDLVDHVGLEGVHKALNIMQLLSENPEIEAKIYKELNKKQNNHG
jgi:hypothetical protein